MIDVHPLLTDVLALLIGVAAFVAAFALVGRIVAGYYYYALKRRLGGK